MSITQLTRINAMGREYRLWSLPTDDKTTIQLVGTGKEIVVNHTIDKVSAWWYNWQMKGMPIQMAFTEFTPGEREFLMTGITPAEWSKLFSEEEK